MDGTVTVRPIPKGISPIYFFLPLVLGLTIGFGIIMGSSSRDDTMVHWPERRCDLDVILAAFMYKPSDDSSTSFEFSSNNFKFCVGAKAEEYLTTLFGSLFGVLEKQMGVADIMRNVLNVMRVQLANIYGPFSSMMNGFWNKFKQIGSLASRIFQHLYMAMKKAAAVATSSIYIAISLQTAMMNSIDLVIKIIMIVLYILLALAVIFFLPILPVLVLVLLTSAGIEEVYPGRTGGMGSVFCFAADTPVAVEDGSSYRISDLKIGTRLLHGQSVEAVIETPGSDIMYSIDGTVVSGDHRILHGSAWIFVKDHPAATRVAGLPGLWTLITSNRQIPVVDVSGSVQIYSDWEELPSTEESAAIWESIVQTLLNGRSCHDEKVSVRPPRSAPCFDRGILVQKYQSGLTPISDICRGDWILGSGDTWTQVLGICQRRVQTCIGEKGSFMTDGVWIWNAKTSLWEHPVVREKSLPMSWQGFNLITDSGSFTIRLATAGYEIEDPSDLRFCTRGSTVNVRGGNPDTSVGGVLTSVLDGTCFGGLF